MEQFKRSKVGNDGVVWALFICFIAVAGFVVLVLINNVQVIPEEEIVPPTAAVGNMSVEDVEVTIVPLQE